MAVRNSTPMSPASTWMNTDEAATDVVAGHPIATTEDGLPRTVAVTSEIMLLITI